MSFPIAHEYADELLSAIHCVTFVIACWNFHELRTSGSNVLRRTATASCWTRASRHRN